MKTDGRTLATRTVAHIPENSRVFVLLMILVSAIGSVCWYVNKHILHLGDPYNNAIPGGGLIDFKAFEPIMPFLHQYKFVEPCTCMPFNGPVLRYPAPVALLYAILYALPHKDMSMRGVMLACFLIPVLLFVRALRMRGVTMREALLFVGASVLTAYSAFIELKTGNMELFVFLLVLFGIRAFLQDRSLLAALLIGTAAGMKIYPAVYLGLLFAQRKYKAIGVAVATAVLLNLLALLYITPSLASSWHGVGLGLSTYGEQMFVGANYNLGVDHSLFALIKRIDLIFFHLRGIRLLLKSYLAIVSVSGALVFFLRICKLPTLNQILLLTIFATFAPPSSLDYTLMNLYIPWAMLVLYSIDHAGQRVAGLTPILLCFVVLLAMESEFIYQGKGLAGQFRALTAVVVFTMGLLFPLSPEGPPRAGSLGPQQPQLA